MPFVHPEVLPLSAICTSRSMPPPPFPHPPIPPPPHSSSPPPCGPFVRPVARPPQALTFVHSYGPPCATRSSRSAALLGLPFFP
ncbi:unnamed protein product [Closterium sp. NIES-54]